MELDTDVQRIRLTSEALVCLAIAADVAPPPLILLQLGVDPSSNDAERMVAEVCERGLRDIASLAGSVSLSEGTQLALRHNIVKMCGSETFLSLRRSDLAGCTLLYASDTPIIDKVDAFGNHYLSAVESLSSVLDSYFVDVIEGTSSESVDLAMSVEDEADSPSTDASPADLPGLEVLKSATTRLIAISNPSKGAVHFLQWWQTEDGFYRADANGEHISLTPTSASDAIKLTMASLTAVSEDVASEEFRA